MMVPVCEGGGGGQRSMCGDKRAQQTRGAGGQRELKMEETWNVSVLLLNRT